MGSFDWMAIVEPETMRAVQLSRGQQFVVIGAGMAGAQAVFTLRTEGFDGRVILLSDEPVRPYDRVPLSKQYLRRMAGLHPLFIHDEGYYADHDIDLRLDTTVAAVDTTARQVVLSSSERLDYDALLLATGAEVKRLPVPGADLPGVHFLRSLHDADTLREAIDAASRLVVLGAGWIGSEVAASARQLGVEVAMVDLAELPLERVLGHEIARFYAQLHADHGVEQHFGVGVTELRGGASVEGMVLSDGRVLEADAVLVGVGVQPRTELAEAAGIAVDNGILVDEYLTTDCPGVFAAGDVANAHHPRLGHHLRLEHWSSARRQGPVAAQNMLGIPTSYNNVPFFFSDQYDVSMEYTGYNTAGTQMVMRGDPGTREFMALWCRDGRLIAGMNVNTWGVAPGLADTIASLVASEQPIDAAALADPDVELASLLPAAEALDHLRRQEETP